MSDNLNSCSGFDKILINNDFKKCQPELFVRSDEDIVHSGQVTWIIQLSDLIEIKKSGQCKESPYIKIGSPSYCGLTLEAYPRGKIEENKSFLSINIRFQNELPKTVWVQGDISIVDKDRQPLLSRKYSNSGNNLKEIGFVDFIRISDLHYYIRDEKLMILCRMKMRSSKYKCTSGRVAYNADSDKESDSYKEMICNSAKFSDVTLAVGGEQIDSHKCILSSEVPALRRLFKLRDEDMYELKGVSCAEFKEMLNYLYSGNIQILNFRHACKLYITADMYEVHNLKDICLAYIACNLSDDNILTAQILADNYKDELLKKACIDFYHSNK